MPSFSALGKFFGRTASEGAAFAAGLAVAPTLHPVVQEVANEAWSKYQSRPLDPGDLAEIVAENVEQLGWGETEAAKTGIGPGNFDALVNAALDAPGVGELLRMWRRGAISDGDFVHGLRKAKLEPRWDAGLEALKTERLDPSVIAAAIQRGLIADPGFLPVGPPSGEGKVPAFPVSGIDALAEAEAAGIDRDRLFVETALVGNPVGPVEAARALFRGLIDQTDFDRAIAEGRTRNEWGTVYRDAAREIPTVTNYIEGRVRDWISLEEMNAGAARHGMSPEDADLLFKVHGRPLTHTQVFIGLLRGGEYDGPTDAIPQPFLKSLQESDIRPEWYNLVWAQRYHYPSFFQTINALNKGWIDAPTATHWLTIQGHAPDAIDTIVSNVAGTKAPAADKHVASAATSVLTAIRRRYGKSEITEAQARDALAKTGLPASTQTQLLAEWTQERDVNALVGPAPTPPTTPGLTPGA